MSEFLMELRDLLNKHSIENESDTPDFILAEYLNNCLDNFGSTMKARDNWYLKNPKPSMTLAEKMTKSKNKLERS